MFAKTVSLMLVVTSLAVSSTSAELTVFPTEYDYMTTHVRRNLAAASSVVLFEYPELRLPFGDLLEATHDDIAFQNLTYMRHYERMNAFYADAQDDSLAPKVYEEMVRIFHTPWLLYAPFAWCDVVFDALESVADSETLWEMIIEGRDAIERLTEGGAVEDIVVFHLDALLARLKEVDPTILNRVNEAYNAIADRAFEKFGFDADVEQSGRWPENSEDSSSDDE